LSSSSQNNTKSFYPYAPSQQLSDNVIIPIASNTLSQLLFLAWKISACMQNQATEWRWLTTAAIALHSGSALHPIVHTEKSRPGGTAKHHPQENGQGEARLLKKHKEHHSSLLPIVSPSLEFIHIH
jgi:hypothetical protein